MFLQSVALSEFLAYFYFPVFIISHFPSYIGKAVCEHESKDHATCVLIARICTSHAHTDTNIFSFLPLSMSVEMTV